MVTPITPMPFLTESMGPLEGLKAHMNNVAAIANANFSNLEMAIHALEDRGPAANDARINELQASVASLTAQVEELQARLKDVPQTAAAWG